MSKWFEVVVTSQHAYAVKAESEDESLDEVVDCVDTGLVTEITCKPLSNLEEVECSTRHGYYV
jgi:hypothetical protein